jgi:hypothetical protein
MDEQAQIAPEHAGRCAKRRARRWRLPMGIMAIALAAPLLSVSPPATKKADAAPVKLYTQVLYEVQNHKIMRPVVDSVPMPYDANCVDMPGVYRSSKIWVDAYAGGGSPGDSEGRWSSMKQSFYTQYSKSIATAMAAFKKMYGVDMPCAQAETYKNMGEVQALRNIMCENPWAKPAMVPTRWCQLAMREANGQNAPSTINLDMVRCREPQWNGGKWGPIGYASWHNQGIKLETTDILTELGLDWVPGVVNLDTYLMDVEYLWGVQNIDPGTLQPWDGEDRFKGYGRVATADMSDKWVRFYDAVARAKGADPINNPIYAHKDVAEGAIEANQKLTINLYPDVPSKSKVETVKVKDYRQLLIQESCSNASPWVKDALGDTHVEGDANVVIGACDTGFSPFYMPVSSAGNGRSFYEFVYNNSSNPKDAEDVRGNYPALPMLFREMYANLDKTKDLLIQNPFGEFDNGQTGCKVERNLGKSRGSHDDVNLRDPRLKHFFKGDLAKPQPAFTGYVDGIKNGDTLAGWACNTGLTSPLRVNLYVGAPKGVGGTFAGNLQATAATESAVNTQCKTQGVAHRFSWKVPDTIRREQGNAPIYAYATNHRGDDVSVPGPVAKVPPVTRSMRAWETLAVCGTDTPTSVAFGPSHVVTFANCNGGLFQSTWKDGVRSPWTLLSGAYIAGQPAAIRRGADGIEVVARGTDNKLHRWSYTGGTGWQYRSHFSTYTVASSPSAISWAGNNLGVFYRTTGNELVYATPGSGAADQTLGGCVADSPTATSMNDGHVDVFVRSCDGSIYHRYFANNAWSGWQSLGGAKIVGRPTVTSWGPGRIDVFGRGTDNKLQHWYYTAASNWAFVANEHSTTKLASDPVVVSGGANVLDVYWVGLKGDVERRIWYVNKWVGVSSLGGTNVASVSPVLLGTGGDLDIYVRTTGSGVQVRRYR